jgi:hypothetical protein
MSKLEIKMFSESVHLYRDGKYSGTSISFIRPERLQEVAEGLKREYTLWTGHEIPIIVDCRKTV